MTIFHEHWWLDTVAENQWTEVCSTDDDNFVARWPFMVKKGPGRLTRLMSPPLTPRLGPLIDSPVASVVNLAEWSRALTSLATKLPRHDHFLQAFHPGIDYWVPLSWRGFTQSTFFTFVITDTADLAAVRRGYAKGTRSDLKKATCRLEIREDQPAHALYQALSETLARSRKPLGYSEAFLARVVAVTHVRGRGSHFSVHNDVGDYLAGMFMVWDADTAYYLLGGATAEARGTGAQTLLIDHAIKKSNSLGVAFDFEGSRIESIEKFFRGFGGRPLPFSRVEHRSPSLNLLLAVKESLAARRS